MSDCCLTATQRFLSYIWHGENKLIFNEINNYVKITALWVNSWRFILNLFSIKIHLTCITSPGTSIYSGTYLIRHTKGPEKCDRLYRMSEYSGFILATEILWDHKFLLDVTGCRNTRVSYCTSCTVLLVFFYIPHFPLNL